jgi:hypothetical protein
MKNYSLKAKIIEKFGTQFEFCEVLGIREDRLSKLIHGRISPNVHERRTIPEKLGVSEDEIWPVD